MQKPFRTGSLAVFVGIMAILAVSRPADSVLKAHTARFMAYRAFTRLSQEIERHHTDHTPGAAVFYHGPEYLQDMVLGIAAMQGFSARAQHVPDRAERLSVVLSESGRDLTLELRYSRSANGAACVALDEKAAVAGYAALLPPLVTIFSAFVFRHFIISLLSGIVLGAMLFHRTLNPAAGLWHAFKDFMLPALFNEFSIFIFLFIAFLMGMVQIMIRCGGIQGMVDAVSRLVRGPRSARLVTFVMGLFIFFDDYTNTMIVGNAMRPLCDRWRISREKLAYLVDSTAAPIAGLAVVSTWIGFEVGQLQVLSEYLCLDRGGYEIFFRLLPFRFYCLFALIVLLASLLLNRDVGPMLRAEQRCLAGLRDASHEKDPFVSAFAGHGPKQSVPCRWANGVLPILIVIISIMCGFLVVGISAGAERGLWHSLALPGTAAVFEQASHYTMQILAVSALLGLLAAAALPVSQRLLSVRETLHAAVSGTAVMKYAAAILVLAWSMKDVCTSLGTAIYITTLLQDVLEPFLIPLIAFAVAAAVSFATGTSWGTMGILLPTIAPVAFQLGDIRITFLCLSAILDGAIFGDHCSPISDTTILSSLTSGCSCVNHLETQLPYGLLAVCITAGAHLAVVLLPVSVVAVYGAGAGLAALFLLAFGTSPEKYRG